MIKPLPNLSDQDEMYSLLNAWEGKRKPIVLTTDQAIKAAYIAAAGRPCYLCGDADPHWVGKKQLPENFGIWASKILFYGLCEKCHMDSNRDSIVMMLVEFDMQNEEENTAILSDEFRERARREIINKVIET